MGFFKLTPRVGRVHPQPNDEYCCGIPISSRHSRRDELVDMRGFCKAVSAASYARCVAGLFYDSESDICYIDANVGRKTEAWPHLLEAAKQWFLNFDLEYYPNQERTGP